ncbi:MAG: SLC13 family permease [Rhodothermales bacterium]|nr:SLC13 family permease [Rhodothermales bacterium]
MNWQAWATVAVVAAMAVALVRDLARPDFVFLGGLGALLVLGILPPEAAFAGFANPAVLAVGALFVVAAGVQQTEALGFMDRALFARRGGGGAALPRLMATTALLSAVLNNTPIVAMLTPRVQAWGQRAGVPASKLLIPLSYAAIVGGMVTLIGTSTNIIVAGLVAEAGGPVLGLFDFTWVGLPVAVVALAYLALAGHRLLPGRSEAPAVFEDGLRDCLFELRVREPLAGQTVEDAGLRHLGEAFLVHLRRGGRIVPAAPDEPLAAGDVLAFTGGAAMLQQLLERPGLEPAVEAGGAGPETLPLYEAVVADTSTLVGKSLRDVRFRERYGGAVLAVHRRSERVEGPLGRLPLKPGDLLLVEARDGFDRRWNARRDEFYLVAPRRAERARPQPHKARLALGILVAMILAIATGAVPLLTAAFVAALLVIATGCLSGQQARRAVDLQVLVVIAAALGVGQAFVRTGLADVAAGGMLAATAGLGAVGAAVVLYAATNVLTELITHKAAAVLMVPIGLEMAEALGAAPAAFALVVAVAAAASFMTPIGYQTNLMVMSAGGYRFRDYLRVGAPMSLVVMGVAVTMIWLVWL